MSEQEAGQPDTAPPATTAQRPAQARAATPEPTVLVVDGTGLLVRCSKAAARQGLHASDGTPTGALVMFINSLAAKIKAVRQGSVIICWDGEHARDWRREIYPEYKANRPSMDDDYWRELAREERRQVLEFTWAAGFPEVCIPGFEADDGMAALWRASQRIRPRPYLVLCTEDQDLHQLLDPHTVALPFSTTSVIEAWDVRREWRVADVRFLPWIRALAGDPSDNIPGLPKIGKARAAQLVDNSFYAWPLIAVGKDDLDQAHKWLSVMDLRVPPRVPEAVPGYSAEHFNMIFRQGWDPSHSVDLQELHQLLDKYELRSIRKRLDEGRLW